MLYVGSKKWGKSLEAYLRTDDIFATDDDKRQIEKLLNKGENVYLTTNPYLSAMHSETEVGTHKYHLLWGTNLDELDDLCYQLQEDV
jgi:hypothetical protein